MTAPTSDDLANDLVDRVAGLAPGSATHTLRHARDKVAVATQGSYDGLFDPALEGISVVERLLVALYATRLTPAPALVEHYRAELGKHSVDAAQLEAAASGQPEDVAEPRLRAMLAFTRTLTLRAVLARHLAEMPNRPMLKPVYQADSYEAILAMARRGTGIAWLPQRLVADDVARGTLAIVGGKDWQIGFDIALYRRAHQPHNVLDAIWQSARQASGDDA